MWVARVLLHSLLNGIAEVFGLPRIICEGCSGKESRLACSRCKVGERSTGGMVTQIEKSERVMTIRPVVLQEE
jgi:hypothetical protein